MCNSVFFFCPDGALESVMSTICIILMRIIKFLLCTFMHIVLSLMHIFAHFSSSIFFVFKPLTIKLINVCFMVKDKNYFYF